MLVCWYFVATLCHQKEEKTKCWDVQNQIEIYPMQRERAPDSESLTGNPIEKQEIFLKYFIWKPKSMEIQKRRKDMELLTNFVDLSGDDFNSINRPPVSNHDILNHVLSNHKP